MRNRFDRQLEKLNTELINMGALCEDAMTCAVHAIFDKDEALETSFWTTMWWTAILSG